MGVTPRNLVNANAYKYFNEDSIVSKANFVLDNFGGVGGPELMIDSGAEDGIKDPDFFKGKVATYQEWIENRPKVTQTVSIVVDILKEMHQALNGGGEDFIGSPTQERWLDRSFLSTWMGLPVGMGINNRIDIKIKNRVSVKWTVQDSTETMSELRLFESKVKYIRT